MSPYDQKIKQLIEATPFWEKDGGGIRGRTIAPLLGGSMGSNVMEDSLPQQFNQQTNRSFAQQEESLPDLILPAMGGGSSILHPWAIYKKTEDSVTYFKIEFNSRVYSGTGSYDNISVTGLDAWIGAQEGYILLKGTVVENEVTAQSIEWGEDGSTPRAEFDGTSKEQTDVTIRLGYAYLDEDKWKIRQDVFGQLTLITTCYDGKPCLCYMQT